MTDSQTEVTLSVLTTLSDIDAAAWDACACPEAADGRPADPFTTYRFLHTLEASGSVGAGTGWQPRYLTAQQDGQVIAVAPLFAKGHSQGEYIFDHNWAHAYENAGGRYYPKLQIAVPFTPVPGPRVLGGNDAANEALLRTAESFAEDNGLSSIHATFVMPDQVLLFERAGWLIRTDQQFHWRNRDYASFEDFLAALSSRKRKAIRKERRTAQEAVTIRRLTGGQIRPEHWDAFWAFYQDTGARKWGTPYLTRAAFDLLGERMADRLLLVIAEIDGKPIAGALNVIGPDRLYGRYWGALADIDCLHFELCYYQAIDAAIEMGLSVVEAGAQGQHKLARGYEPTPTYSAHYIPHEGFRAAVADYLARERVAVERDIEFLGEMGPFRKG